LSFEAARGVHNVKYVLRLPNKVEVSAKVATCGGDAISSEYKQGAGALKSIYEVHLIFLMRFAASTKGY